MIPRQSELFLKYLADPTSLKKYYPNTVESVEGIAQFVPELLANYKTDRAELCDALNEINIAAGAGQEILGNIELLREKDTVAVLTGQQAGLFTGPLYTVYKALSAIKMAEQLRDAGIKAVPVFWAATEDHDFEEVSEAWSLDSSGVLIQSKYQPADSMENAQVGNVVIDAQIEHVVDDLFSGLPVTVHSAAEKEAIIAEWGEGRGFGAAFIATLVRLLGEHGIVFVDPTHPKLRKLAAPIFASAVRESEGLVDAIIARSRELTDDGFHAQALVEPDYFPLFWIDDEGRRLPLRKAGDGLYRIKGTKQELSRSELEDIAVNEPDRFSPGVMLRSVVQDHLFPTACYFGGGAEIAYFAQNSVVYQMLGRPVTPIFHRQSFTVVEPKQKRAFEKLGLDFEQMFDGIEAIELKLSAGFPVMGSSTRLFADAEEIINTELNRMDQHVSQIDATLAAHLAKRRRKIVYHVAALRKKTLLAQSRSDEIFQNRLNGLFAALLPNGELQERSINVFSFIDRYGPHFIDWIYDAIDLDDRGHRLIEL